MARRNAEEGEITARTISSLLEIGTTVMLGECVTTAEPAVLQTGQTWEEMGLEVKSAQKWNCAPRKKTPRSKATTPSRESLAGM